jgi:hypothetical protein
MFQFPVSYEQMAKYFFVSEVGDRGNMTDYTVFFFELPSFLATS